MSSSSEALSPGERLALVSDLTCPVCLQLYTQPVLLRCGHSFCLGCIQTAWSAQPAPAQQQPPKSPPPTAGAPSAAGKGPRYACPECRDEYASRPILQRNLKLFSVTERLRESLSRAAAAVVNCDYCDKGKESAAVSTCLKCEISLCARHEAPHRERAAFASHALVRPATRLHELTCPRHGQPLQRYCSRQRACLCAACDRREHAGHEHDDIAQAAQHVRAEVTQLLERLDERERSLSASSAQIDAASRQLQERVREVHSAAERGAEAWRHALDGGAGLEGLARAEALGRARHAARVARAQRHVRRARRAVAAARGALALRGDVAAIKAAAVIHKTLLGALGGAPAQEDDSGDEDDAEGDDDSGDEEEGDAWLERELCASAARGALLATLLARAMLGLAVFDARMLRRYGRPLTFDPASAHPRLLVSPDGRGVRLRGRGEAVAGPAAYDVWPQLLSREALGGPAPAYWEVGVRGARNWRVGVARRDSPRRGGGADVCLGANAASWCLALTAGELSAWHDNRQTLLPPQRPEEEEEDAGGDAAAAAAALAAADSGLRGGSAGARDARARAWEQGGRGAKGAAAAAGPAGGGTEGALPAPGLRRVGVLLDRAEARLAFYDAERGTELHAFCLAGAGTEGTGPRGRLHALHAAAGLWDPGACLTLYAPLSQGTS